jgi:type I restriction-modification system DNA methylase subunit
MSEDRGMEEYELLKQLTNKSRIYKKLVELFDVADQKYNSGIFHFNKESGRAEPEDALTPSLDIDDGTLTEIISNLYYPKSPYAFGVIGSDILGQVYERFLGKVIRLTEGHRAKVEEKPEVRKAGGVYYTPSNIVQYIVKNTVGKACENKSPDDLADLRILDPGCGSGSFLVEAYSYLLDYHLRWYVKKGSQKYPSQVRLGEDNEYHLTPSEKKRILLNHIFGVDKDSQAVEVTKLNLLLKVLEGEREESIEQQQKLFKQRALPDLGRNITWGNSLIDPSFYQQTNLLGEPNQLPIGFDWEREFPKVFEEGGFSVIIGNPPYLMIEELPETERKYFSEHFSRTYMKRYDAYGLFVDRSIDLLRQNGLFGMIIPSTVLNNVTFTKLRKLILDETNVTCIANLGGKVFKNVNNDTLILLLTKDSRSKNKTEVYDVPKYGGGLATIQETGEIDLKASILPPSYSFELRVTEEVEKILTKMKQNSIPLGEICGAFQGLIAGNNNAFFVTPEEAKTENLETRICKRVVFADEMERYGHPIPRYLVIYLTNQNTISDFPNIQKRLEPFKTVLNSRAEAGLRPWYSLHRPRDAQIYEANPKILVQDIRNLALKRRIVATMDTRKLYADHTINVVCPKNNEYDTKYILGILNSKLVNYLFQHKYLDIHMKGVYLEEIPIKRIEFSDQAEVLKSERLVGLVNEILTLNEKIQQTKLPDERKLLERQIVSVDYQIDKIVYDLYGLTSEERTLVDNSL